MANSIRLMSTFKSLIQKARVQQDVEKSMFFVKFNSHVAYVEYEKDGNVYDLVHSKIPDDLQGHGVGSVFAEKIFDYLVEENKKFRITCHFLHHFYTKNVKKYEKFVVD